MRKSFIFPVVFLGASTLMACSFSMRAGSGTNQPNNPSGQPSQSAAAAKPNPTAQPTTTVSGTPIRRLGKRPTPTPTSSNTTPAPTPTTPPTGAPVVSGPTIFGSGTADSTGFKGNIYFLPAGTTKIPALASMQPNGFLFTKEINVTPQAFSTGFPGVDPARKENFAIRYEAPLIVTAEADFDFRVVADDGAMLLIDGTPIVDNDGAKAAPAEKTGPVHLVAGTHVITVDYMQTAGNVALQVFCKKGNDAEKVCPTQL